ncbi:MAG: sigma 54-interacting transcriptional regulator [Bryobacteraceae bacterium]|nr:sigma 54-interacting transcriptional regulator [Bryobacteraceae bacterium]
MKVTQGDMAKLNAEWQSPEVFLHIFDNVSDALVLYDKDHVIRGVNAAAEQLLGVSAEELVGRDCRQMFHCEECEPGCGLHPGLVQLNGHNGAVRLHTPNGFERLVVLKTTPFRSADGSLEGFLATIKDVGAEVESQKREIIAESPAMREVLHFVRRVAISEASTILIEGENGVGKDLIAKFIHYQSLRAAEPFIAINCAAIPETLLESELFGYEKGAFTDARAQKRGIFELADKGTLFLDEIGEIPLMLQAKLLRVLEEQSFRRLGGLRDINLDLRVIAATNKNLRDAVKEGAFRQDLYFRLNVIHITIPPLRERPEDIAALANFFVQHYNRKFKRQMAGISPEAMRMLLAHDWPGNVRELRNAIERAMILEDSDHITPASLPRSISRLEDGPSDEPARPEALPAIPDTGLSLEENERRLIIAALEKTGGNQTQAARLLQITRDTLRYKMKKFKLR